MQAPHRMLARPHRQLLASPQSPGTQCRSRSHALTQICSWKLLHQESRQFLETMPLSRPGV